MNLEDALDDEAVEVLMRIEQRAKTVDEGHPTDQGIGARSRAGAAQRLLHDAQENAQRQCFDRRIVLDVLSQPLGNQQHLLANLRSRKNVVGQIGSSFDHPPGVASGTDTTALARPGYEKIVTALGAPGAGKAIGENLEVDIAAELTFDMGWAGGALAAVAREFEPGGEVRLRDPFGPATAIVGSASTGTGGRRGKRPAA